MTQRPNLACRTTVLAHGVGASAAFGSGGFSHAMLRYTTPLVTRRGCVQVHVHPLEIPAMKPEVPTEVHLWFRCWWFWSVAGGPRHTPSVGDLVPPPADSGDTSHPCTTPHHGWMGEEVSHPILQLGSYGHGWVLAQAGLRPNLSHSSPPLRNIAILCS